LWQRERWRFGRGRGFWRRRRQRHLLLRLIATLLAGSTVQRAIFGRAHARPKAYPGSGAFINRPDRRSLKRKRAQRRDNGRRKQDDQPHGTDKPVVSSHVRPRDKVARTRRRACQRYRI